jgi:predicted RNase H-like nuclease (RuvC/YqgF family)
MFQTETARPEWLDHIIAIWPILAAIGGGVAAIAGLILGVRWYEKSGIKQTNQETITALNLLIAARDQEIDDRDETIEQLSAELATLQENHETLKSEYQSVAGIVIAELLEFVANMENYYSKLDGKDSEIRILKRRIDNLENAQANNKL